MVCCTTLEEVAFDPQSNKVCYLQVKSRQKKHVQSLNVSQLNRNKYEK